MALTEQQVSALRAAYDYAIAHPDAEGAAVYYTELGKHSVYGRLALGVQQDDTLGGITANNYANNKLNNDLVLGYSINQQDAVREALLKADFAAREAAGWNEIGGNTISNYHDVAFYEVYGSNALAPHAWTAYHIVRSIGDYDVWNSEAPEAYASIYFQLVLKQNNPLAESQSTYVNAYDWSQDMRTGLVIDWRDYSVKFGDRVAAESAATYAVLKGGTFAIERLIKISSDGASEGNAFWSTAVENVLMDAVYRSPEAMDSAVDGFTTFNTGSASINVNAANISYSYGSDWLIDIRLGAKLSLIGEFNQANWQKVETSGAGVMSLFGQIDAMTVEEITLQTSGTTISAGNAPTALLGGNYSGTFIAGQGNAYIFAGGGADRLQDGQGNDFLAGGDGHDFIISQAGEDVIDGGGGNDVIDARDRSPDVEGVKVVVREGSGHDYIKVAGRQTGSDWRNYEEHSGVEEIDFAGIQSSEVTLYWDWHVEDEFHLGDYIHSYSGFGDAAIVVNATGESIFVGRVNGSYGTVGGVREDNVSSTSAIRLRFSDRVIDGNDWDELFKVDSGTAIGALSSLYTSAEQDFQSTWTINPGGGVQSQVSAGNDVVAGSFGSDTLNGLAGNDTLLGYEGNDVIVGGLGADHLRGGSGNDFIEGGADGDVINGQIGTDIASYESSNAGVYVNLDSGVGHFGHAEGDSISGIENVVASNFNDVVIGDGESNALWLGSGDDFAFGSVGDDTLDGGDGTDTLEGGSGSDWLVGGEGDDVLRGGNDLDYMEGGAGADTLDGEGSGGHALYWSSYAGVTIDLQSGTSSGGHADGDVLVNILHLDGSSFADVLNGDGNDNWIVGRSGHDVLNGQAGNDTLRGDSGDDQLDGGDGWDLLTGGAGSDEFIFKNGTVRDYVTDFQHGIDKLKFEITAFMSSEDALASSYQDGPNTIIETRVGDIIVLQGFQQFNLTASDFLFI